MADIKVTKMVLKVDLQCCKCYKKIKKVLCRYPQIRDQVYDEKQNTVTITVVCCSPECIRDKIICKAGDTVKSIEIVPEKEELAKPPKEEPPKPPKEEPVKPPKEPVKSVVQGFPLLLPLGFVSMYPMGVCCCCYVGRPCYHGQGPMCYGGCRRPTCDCNRGYYVSCCDE